MKVRITNHNRIWKDTSGAVEMEVCFCIDFILNMVWFVFVEFVTKVILVFEETRKADSLDNTDLK